jgi:fluoroacetyl-CoA thioesterase
MRPGPARGETASVTFTVTPEMTARVGEREIHPAFGTHALVAQIERLCRELLEPHLEEGEEGVGYEIRATHHAPAPVGAELEMTATVADVNSKRLLCEIGIRRGSTLVATGSFEQRLVDAEEFNAGLDSDSPAPAPPLE